MLRFLITIALLAVCVPCYGQAKKKQPVEKFFTFDVGARFEVTTAIVAAASKFDAEELQQSIDAKDAEGIEAMVDGKTAVKFRSSATIAQCQGSGRAI